jgi:hypothetical protein
MAWLKLYEEWGSRKTEQSLGVREFSQTDTPKWREPLTISNYEFHIVKCRYPWPRGLRRTSAAARLLGSRVWIPLLGIDICLSCLYVVLSCVGRGMRRADNSSRGVLPCVLYVRSYKPRKGGLCSNLGTKRKMSEGMSIVKQIIYNYGLDNRSLTAM